MRGHVQRGRAPAVHAVRPRPAWAQQQPNQALLPQDHAEVEVGQQLLLLLLLGAAS